MAQADIPGVAVCLIRDGKPAWVEGLGVTDRGSKHPVSVDTIFSIQSTSKNITAVATRSRFSTGSSTSMCRSLRTYRTSAYRAVSRRCRKPRSPCGFF